MTTQVIFSPVQTAPLVNPDGTGTSQLLLYLNQFLARTGGVTGGTYQTLNVNSGTVLWDLSASPIASVQLQSGSNILTVLNAVAGAPPNRLTIVQPTTGAAGTVTWPGNFVFPGGIAPTLSTGNSAVDMLDFVSNGTNIYLRVLGLNYLT
jgi:hypothetical protein